MYEDIQKADIERYALGLTTPRETARIEGAMEEQPELRQLVEDIQRDLHEYAEKIHVPPLRPGRQPDPNRFLELDDEMLEVISRQNERLRRWFSVLSVVIVLLAGLAAYLYYLNGVAAAQLRHDRASLRQELNYANDHWHQAERQMDAWKSAAQFAATLPVENIDGARVSLYTFESGEKVLLNLAALPGNVSELVVWDERRPNQPLWHLDCTGGEDKLHYINLHHRDQVQWLKTKAVTNTDVVVIE
jgi:anti-sigma-K factor RskA